MNVTKAKECGDGDPTPLINIGFQVYQDGPSMPSPATEGANWGLICQIGYVWTSQIMMEYINCSKTGSWSSFPPACSRMLDFQKA